MRIFPIIPIWIMLIICGLLIFYIIKKFNNKQINIAIVALLFIINLRIMIPTGKSENLTNNLDVLFVIDSTISMNAEDYDGNNTRLSGVKKDCEYIIDKLGGAHYSVISFNNKARRLTPFSSDINITKEAINSIEPVTSLYAKGSSLNVPLEDMIEAFKLSKDGRVKVLFYVSDGEITNDKELESFKKVRKYVSNGAVLGYGTDKGGNMKAKYSSTSKEEYIKDPKDYYSNAVSKIDEKNLKKIAKDIKIDYIHMSNTKNIDKKLSNIKRKINNKLESTDKSTYTDTYYILIIPLLILLCINFNTIWRKSL
jgi:Ca-activated chloride channel family protein